ncbi:MAG TPA: DnaJ domain-containing protein, partial [Polyangiaceae bacterium]|nr:DnaJ domain-containing protein [Polyangiaceae bacterium]
LIYALDQGLTGTTQLIAPDGAQHFIYFADGVPGKVRTSSVEWPLDRVLTDLHMLDELTLQQSLLAISKTGELHGRYLVARGILDASSVMRALAAQLARKMTVLFELPPETRYFYFAGHNQLDGYGGPELTPVEPLALISRGVRRLPQELIRDTVARVGDAPLRIARDGDIGRLQLTEEERAVVDLLVTRPFVLRELLARDGAQEPLILRTLYLLIVTRYLKMGAAGRPVLGANKPRYELPPLSMKTPAPTSSQPSHASVVPAYRRIDSIPSSQSVPPRDSFPDVPSSVPPAVKSSPGGARVQPRVSIRRTPISPRDSTPAGDDGSSPPRRGPSDQDIEARFRNIDDLTFYEILGVDSKAPEDNIEAAYFQLAKLWHPDRVPENAAALRPKVAKIFARMNEAYQTLSDPDRRRDYDGVVSAGGGTARDRELVERAVDSALLFQKAEVFFRRGNLEHAEKLLTQAVITDPQQPEYRALLAWIQAKRLGAPPKGSEGDPSFHYREQLRILNEVLDKEPHFERALFYRAELYKLSGDMDRAIRDYRKVVKLNKRNIDAAREVRLYDMRAQKSGGGLFGGLFGKSQKPSKPPRTPTSGRPRK